MTDFDPNNLYQKLENVKNAADQQHFAINRPETIKVSIRVDNKITPSKFISDPLIPGGYKAHESTIRAMRADLFAAGDDLFEDLQHVYKCDCGETVDIQFWKFCPHCERNFPNDLPPSLNSLWLIN